MSDDMPRTGTDARVDEQRAYEGDAEQRDHRDDDPARRDQTITSDRARHDDRSTAHDAMLEGERRRDPRAGGDPRDASTGTEPAGGTATDAHDVGRDPSSERRGPTAGPDTTTEWSDGLLSSEDRTSYQRRWDDIQVRFIDEPRESVRQADDLVDEVTSRIADRFSSARRDMEQRWEGGNEPTTEELRQAVQRYRDFFQRLVAQ